ncbi:MAG TPA: hypothetical protein VKU60_14930 [Chloroflexota bacterium]|nr:hypothetical protein [Chloroflexota bacterium]
MVLAVNTRYLPLALRAYAEAPQARPSSAAPLRPSRYSLVFDCETTTHLEQELRFGMYAVYDGDMCIDQGAFSGLLQPGELDVLQRYCDEYGLTYCPLHEFIAKVFYEYGYALHGNVIGFNLPFDISRLAQRWTAARGSMLGGWTFFLLEDEWQGAPIQIRSLSHKRALIRFRTPRRGRYPSRSMANRKVGTTPFHGHFVDVHTLALSLLGTSFSLDGLCQQLHVAHPKLKAKAHGKVTADYLKYAQRDVLATWECFQALRAQLRASGLTVEPSALYSEAGVAKSVLRQMGVKPWRELQPGFSPNLLGIIWSTYYAGRSELRLRKAVQRCAYLDFTSQYPTVAILLDIWRFLTASEVKYSDATQETRAFLEDVTLEQLLQPETWKQLAVLVLVEPDEDVLPVRAPYAGPGDNQIGENLLTSKQCIWYTLAHAVASKLRTGKAPKILQALRFTPGPLQEGLQPMQLFGKRIRPTDDLYKVLIEHRQQLRAAGKEHEQLAVKLAANSLAAGIFGEINASSVEETYPAHIRSNGDSHTVRTRYVEEPGLYYHPLLATLVTSGGRLLLAMLETAGAEYGLEWAMCDTDSMVFTQRHGIALPEEIGTFVQVVVDRFERLNPYSVPGLLKVEDVCHFYGVSAKRYALFEYNAHGQPLFRRVSGHALGYLASPVEPWPEPVELEDAAPWHVDFWRQLLDADYGPLPGFDTTAIMPYSITRPSIEDWLPLRPFSFLTVLLGKSRYDAGGDDWREIRPIAPFTRSPQEAEALAVDRQTGKPLGPDVALLATYAEALADFHVHPESKFDPDPHAVGLLPRCHVVPDGFRLIGKEANLADERAVFGSKDMDAAIEYASVGAAETSWRDAFAGHSLSELGRHTGYSKTYLSLLLAGKRDLTEEVRMRFQRAVRELRGIADCSQMVEAKAK